MNSMLEKVINWSEVWALLIPLAVIIRYKKKNPGTLPLVLYVWVALALNAVATIMVEYYYSMPLWLRNNNILYNIHSVTRVLLFSWYILSIREYRYPKMLNTLLVAYLIFVCADLIFWENPFFLGSHLFTAESIILLLFCLLFFFRSMQDEGGTNWLQHPAFLVCTGICLYEAVSFFIFLFFYPLSEKNLAFGDMTMNVHNIIYVVLCIILALAIARSRLRSST